MAQMSLGSIGSVVIIIVLIAAMILIIQTGYNGSARSMYSMAAEGNLPSVLGKLTKNGIPLNAMIAIAVFNLFLITVFTVIGQGAAGPAAILSASAIGYVFANGISLAAYWKASTDPKFNDLPRPFKAPKGWKFVAAVFAVLNIPFYLIGILYLNSLDYGIGPVLLGFVVLACFIPLWLWARKEAGKKNEPSASHR